MGVWVGGFSWRHQRGDAFLSGCLLVEHHLHVFRIYLFVLDWDARVHAFGLLLITVSWVRSPFRAPTPYWLGRCQLMYTQTPRLNGVRYSWSRFRGFDPRSELPLPTGCISLEHVILKSGCFVSYHFHCGDPSSRYSCPNPARFDTAINSLTSYIWSYQWTCESTTLYHLFERHDQPLCARACVCKCVCVFATLSFFSSTSMLNRKKW